MTTWLTINTQSKNWQKIRKYAKLFKNIFLIVIGIFFISFIFATLKMDKTTVTIIDKEVGKSLTIEEYFNGIEQGWFIPFGGTEIKREEKVHHYADDTPVYATFYTYQTKDWKYLKTIENIGEEETELPSYELKDGQRIARINEYCIITTKDNNEHIECFLFPYEYRNDFHIGEVKEIYISQTKLNSYIQNGKKKCIKY